MTKTNIFHYLIIKTLLLEGFFYSMDSLKNDIFVLTKVPNVSQSTSVSQKNRDHSQTTG